MRPAPGTDTSLRVQATSTAAAMKAERPWGIVLALGALYFIWGSTYLAIRFALDGFPPLLMSGARFVIAGAVLYLLLRTRGAPRPSAREWGASAVVGTLLVCGNALVVVAEQWVSSGVAAVAIASMPIWAVLIGGFFGHWPARLEWAGLAVGICGVLLLEGGDLRASPVGAVALLFSTLSWALGSMLSKRLPLPRGPVASACEMLCGGAVLTLAALVHRERFVAVPPPRALAAFGYLVVFGSMIAYSAYAYLLRAVRPSLATSYAYVNPVVAVGLGALLAGESFAPASIGALALILAGVGILAAQGRGRAETVSKSAAVRTGAGPGTEGRTS
jgi:drug/metabolite transporter (DMT)-like permease